MIERDAPCSTVISQSQHQVMKNSQTAFLLESGSFIEDILTVQFPTDHLTSVTLNEWTMLLRTDFDLFYEDEPFSVIMLLIHLKSGQFLTRVWNKTISQGVIKDVEDLENVIRSTFRCTLPCLGVQEDLENGLCETTRLPFERFVSRDCQLAYFKGEEETLEEAIDGRCQPCQVVLDGSSSSSTSENENNDEAATTLEETPSPSAKTHRNQDTQTDPFHQLEPILTSTKEDEPSRQESSSPRHYRISDKNQVDSFEISKSPDAAPKTVDGELVTVVTNSLNHESANDDDEISLPPRTQSAAWLKAESTDASGLFVAKKSIPTHDEGSANNSENNHSEDDPAEMSAENERREEIQFKSCRFCDRSFNTKSACFSHERRVHFAGNFKCSECDHVASTISNLTVHFSSDHPLVQDTQCSLCKENFEVVYELAEHYKSCLKRRLLQNVRRCQDRRRDLQAAAELQCPHCPKVYAQKFMLEQHIRFHTGEKPHACKLCNFRTHNKLVLYRHNKIHRRSRLKELSAQSGPSREEEDAEDCLYEHCEHCGKRFACGTALKQHVNYVHKKVFDNVKCEECGQNFERRTQLNRHKILVHSVDPKYSCQICNKRFGTMGQVKQHYAKHQEEGDFKCKYCGRALKKKNNLRSHEENHERSETPYGCLKCSFKCCTDQELLNHHKETHNFLGEIHDLLPTQKHY